MQTKTRVGVGLAALMLIQGEALGADRALVVGIADYGSKLIRDLPGVAKDLGHMREFLHRDLGFEPSEIEVLSGAQATRDGILAGIQTWLIDGTQPGDRIFLYFSGHGVQIMIPDGKGGTRPTSGLVPFDAQLIGDEPPRRVSGAILGPQLGGLIRSMAERDVTIVVDACHSASVTKGLDALLSMEGVRTITPDGPAQLDPADLAKGMVVEAADDQRLLGFNSNGSEPIDGVAVWSAASISQFSWDSPQGGVYTNAFIRGVHERRAARDGTDRVTSSGLLDYVRREAEAFCKTEPRCTLGFTPELLAPNVYRARVIVPVAESVGGSQQSTTPLQGQELVGLGEDIFSHRNDFDLKAEILPSTELKLGGTVRFRITSSEPGELLVLDTGPDGKLRRIFPNKYSEATEVGRTIRASAPLTIPDQRYGFEFTATDPGQSTLMVLVAEPGTDYSALLATPAFKINEYADKALLVVASELQAPVMNERPEDNVRARRWAYVSVPYFVEK